MSGLLRSAKAFGINMIFVLLYAAPPVSATAQGVSLGFKGGLNRSTNTSELNPNLGKARTGFHVGTILTIQSSGPFALQVGASYTKKGANLETGVPGVTGGFELSYVEVPALAVIVFPAGPTSKVAPFIVAGPAIGFEVSCDVKGENQGVPVSGSCTDAGAATKSVDVGVMLGGGLRFATGPASVVLDAA